LAFITQAVSFSLMQLISASSTSSLTVPKEPWSLSLPKGPHRLGQLRLCGGPVLAFNIHGFPAFAWNDGTGEVCPPRALVTFTSRHRHLRVCGGPVFLLPAHFDSVSLLPSVKFRALPWQCFCLITVAHASGSERSVLFPWLFLLLFRGSASASSSASFREIPC